MKHALTFCICFLAAGFSLAQSIDRQLLSVAGENSAGASIQLDWAIGEPFIQSHPTHFGFLTEGFIQPSSWYTRETPVVPELEIPGNENGISITVFPNPFTAIVQLTFSEPLANRSYIRIFESTGKMVYSILVPAESGQAEIDLSQLPEGIYFLLLSDHTGKILNNSKVVKM